MSSPVTSQLLEQEIMGKYRVQNLFMSGWAFIDHSMYCLVCLLPIHPLAEEPWANDTKLYQPYEAEQILLAENASCLAVKAYLNVMQRFLFRTSWMKHPLLRTEFSKRKLSLNFHLLNTVPLIVPFIQKFTLEIGWCFFVFFISLLDV